MHDLATMISEPPDGFAATVFKGWDDGPGYTSHAEVEDVPFGTSSLPEFFTLVLEPHPVPDDEDEGWNLVLRFQVMRGDDLSELRSARCSERDLASVLDAARDAWPLSKWRQWAHVVLMLGAEVYIATPEQISAARKAVESARPRRRRRTTITDGHLQRVAEVYSQAPAKPTQAVERHFITNHSTAARWVGLARKAGYLPPTGRSRST